MCHGDVIYSISDPVNNIIVIGDRRLLDVSWWSFHNVFKCRITMLYT